MNELAALALAAFALDLLLGDPSYRLHPIRLMGRWITFLEAGLRRAGLDGRLGGSILAAATAGAFVGMFLLFSGLAARLHPIAAMIVHLYVIYSCLALGDLFRHVRRVSLALEGDDLHTARQAVGRIVGREVSSLDRWGVGRAAVETLAENFVDGFLSPLFWLILGGTAARLLGWSPIVPAVCAMLIFKAASTLDSMVGYRDARYARFGWAGARADDAMNFVPARLSIPILIMGAAVSGLSPMKGLQTAMRDRLKHDSPNSGHAESFAAGALGVSLGGPAQYGGSLKNKSWLGDGPSEVEVRHIHATVILLRRSAWIGMVALLCPLLFL